MWYLYKVSVVSLLIVFILSSSCLWGYNGKTTHREINKSAAMRDEIDEIFKNRFGLKNGIVQKFRGKDAWSWMAEGGEKEDADFSSDGAGIRYRKHFHDPLTENWGDAGLWGVFDSALLWALFEDRVGYRNGFSWNSARSQEVGVGPSQVIDIMSDWW